MIRLPRSCGLLRPTRSVEPFGVAGEQSCMRGGYSGVRETDAARDRLLGPQAARLPDGWHVRRDAGRTLLPIGRSWAAQLRLAVAASGAGSVDAVGVGSTGSAV